MKRKFFIVAAVLFSGQLQAQIDSSQTLDEVVFTANKSLQKQSSTGKVLTVISRHTLENNTGRTLAQVLNEQAGVVISGAQNPLGGSQFVYVRGAATASTLVLVDGVPANDASGISAQFDINHFAIDQIERVEILKGSQSVLYGSDAVAGVINIITKKQHSNKPVGFTANAATGTYGTVKGTAAVSGQLKGFTYNVQYSKLTSNGFSAAEDTTGKSNFDKDGFGQDLFGLNMSVNIAKGWKLRLFGQYDRYNADIDDASFADDKNNRIENKNLQAGISSLYEFSKGTVTVNLNLNNTERKLDDVRNVPDDPNDYDPFNGLYKGKSIFAEAYTNLNLHQNISLLIGADLRSQKANIKTTFGDLGEDSLKATLVSGYASVLLKSLGGFTAEAGGRFSQHSEFGSNVTYSFNPSYLINKEFKIFANLSSGFRAPTIYNLASEYGNKQLKPEKSTSFEAGVQYINKKSTVNVRLAYFNRLVKDLIVFNSLFTAPYGQYGNADKQKDNGLEVEATFRPAERWRITANYAFVNGNIETVSGATGKDTSFYNLYRRPKHIINTTVGFQATKKLYANLGFRVVGKAFDQYFNLTTFSTELKELPSYHNLDLHVSYMAHTSVKVFADIRNITNQQYAETFGYNSRRFNFMAGAAVNF